MIVGPSSLCLATPVRFFQEESEETTSTQAPSTPARPAARDRDASVPAWAYLLLIPIALALVALVLFRRRGYNPNRRLDLKKQPEGVRYREKVALTGADKEEKTTSSNQAKTPEPAHARFRNETALTPPKDNGDYFDDNDWDEPEVLPEPQFVSTGDAQLDDSEESFDDDEFLGELDLDLEGSPSVAEVASVKKESAESDDWDDEDESWPDGDAAFLNDEEDEESGLPSFPLSEASPAPVSSSELPAPAFHAVGAPFATPEKGDLSARTVVVADSEELLRLRQESGILQDELAVVRRTLERVQASHIDALSAADEKLHLLQSEIESARAACRDTASEADSLKNQLSQLRQKNDALSLEVETNRTELTRLRESAAAAVRNDQGVAAAKVQIEDLRQKIAAMDEEHRHAEHDRRALRERIEELTAANQQSESRNREVQQKLDAMTSRWKEMQSQDQGLSTSELLDKLNEKRKMLRLVQDKLREKLILIDEMKREQSGRRSGKA